MIDKAYLFEKLTAYCKGIRGVDEHVLDAHLHQQGLALRPDHRSFLLQYGNSNELLKFWFGDCTYSLFEQYTSNPQEELSGFDELPDGTVFFGLEFTEGILCIDNQLGKIYIYHAKEIYYCMYKDIDSFLFFCLIECLRNQKKISVVELLLFENDAAEQVKQEHEAYYLADMDNFSIKYFLKNNRLISMEFKGDDNYVVEYFQGEVLDVIARGV